MSTSLQVYQEQGGPEYLVLDRERRADVKAALDAGWMLDCVSLVGSVSVAIGHLEGLHLADDLNALGLSWRRLADEADVNAVGDLYRQTFAEDPTLLPVYFGPLERFMANSRNGLLAMLSTSHRSTVILRDEVVVGHFHATAGGVELLLDSSIRGRGIAPIATLRMLYELREANVKTISGVGANKAILKLGRRIGRTVRALYFCRESHHPLSYWEDYWREGQTL